MASSEWRGPGRGGHRGGHSGGHNGGQPSPVQTEWRKGRSAAYPEQSEPRAPPAESWHHQGEFSGSSGRRTPPSDKWHGASDSAPPAGPSAPKQRPPPQVLGQSDRPVVSNMCELVLTVISWLIVMAFFPLSMFACVRVVQEYERAIIFRLGRLLPGGAQGPGLFLMLPCLDKFTCVDLRVVSFDVAPQEILTKDLVTISVDAVVYFRIFEPIVSVTNVENSGYSTRLLAATTLRTVLGQYSLADILSQRESIAGQMQGVLDDATDAWGVKVERVEVKDVRLPQELQRAMAAEAEASREAKAKVIAAEGEMKASLSLKNAADIMCTSPSALQLRYLQTLNTISAEKNSTIIFPVPIDILGGLNGGKFGRTARAEVGSPSTSGAGTRGGHSRGNGNESGRSGDGRSDPGWGDSAPDEGGGAEGGGNSGGGGGVTTVKTESLFGVRPRPGFSAAPAGGLGEGTSVVFGTGTSVMSAPISTGSHSNGSVVTIVPGSSGVRV
ncbi:band 7 protein AGAP004871-like [Amphibalanus amphitrite]|uniref:band 7 protein AGAP004871-like n=1 Tax=Amphibalanus amphitrite TaxID=1232801 RepID=UPI001C92224A|nr:band 7 protein AGAP004871-like [Amphibalanus amphitrite]